MTASRADGKPMKQSPGCLNGACMARLVTRIAAAAVLAMSATGASRPVFADPPPAVIETPMRDPWVPPEARHPSTSPPTRGAALHAQVERKLAASFEAADVNHTGALTRDEAKAAGLGFIVKHFDDIDTRRSGLIRFDDVTRYLDERRARTDSTRRPE